MEIRSAAAVDVFQIFTALERDTKTYLLDIRPQKDFKKKHILQAYSIRLAANGKALLDYSKNEYSHPWSQDCWWDKHVVVYGDAGNNKASKSHGVVAYLAKENRAKSLSIFKPGFDVFEPDFPFLCTSSIKANAFKRFPAAIVPGLLYLGGWDSAEAHERLQELNIKRIMTVHNNPEDLRPQPGVKHLTFCLPDVATANIAPLFQSSYVFIEEAKKLGHAALIHCGAGASRSAALCIAYLMRASGWSAQQAREHCLARRSVVQPNEGFWQALCAYEHELGIPARSNPAAMQGVRGTDAVVDEVPEAIARQGVTVTFHPAQQPAAAAAHKRAGDARADDARRPKRSRHDEEHTDHDQGRARPSTDEDDRDRHRDRRANRDGERQHDRDMYGDSKDHTHPRDAEPERDRDRQGAAHIHRQRDTANGAGSAAVTEADAPAIPDEGVVLEVVRDGQVMGRLVVGLKQAGQRCLIGRDATPGACDIVLEHASVSRRHAQLSAGTGALLSLTDLGSAHGTNLDGAWLRPNTARQLKVGAVLKFGGSTRTYVVKSLPQS